MNEDTQKLIGTLLGDGQGQRDAVHVAVVPVTAGEDLEAGDRVKLALGTTDTVLACERGVGVVGIIDPFLGYTGVHKGQRCFLFLLPNTVTGMRHHWLHPAFDSPRLPASDSEHWLREFAGRRGIDYDHMVAAAQDGGAITSFGTEDRRPEDEEWCLFWSHLERLTGRVFDANARDNVQWTCSC